MRYVFVGTLLCAVGGLLLAALVLRSPVFSDLRRSIVADYLSDLIGQELVIENDVKVILGADSHLIVSGATIPSVLVDGVKLAELNVLELDLDMSQAIWGRWAVDDIKIDGIHIDLTTTPDGTTSWSGGIEAQETSQAQPIVGPIEANGIIFFLSDKVVEVTSVSLSIDNQVNGFEFLYDLQEMSIEQMPDDAGVKIASHGTVNGFPFKIDGNYPRGATSVTSMALGDFVLRFDGQALSEAEGGGIGGELSVDTGAIGDFLDILKLDGRIDGHAEMTTRLVSQGGRLEVEALQATLNLQNGTEIDLEGAVQDLMTISGLDVLISGRFFAPGNPPKRATKLKDLELSTAKARIISEGDGLKLVDARVDTNLFETEFESFGPFSIGKIRRTEQGTLALQDIYLQAGPEDAPYLIANGAITDLFHVQGIDFSGGLRAPISLMMDQFKSDIARAFGNISAGFEVSDASGHLALTKLDAKSENTTLWSMSASAVTTSFRNVKGTDVELEFDIPDGSAFLEALQADQVDIGRVSFSTAIKGIDHGLEAEMSAGLGETSFDAFLNAVFDGQKRPTVRGRVHSDVVRMTDIDRAGQSIVSLSNIVEKTNQGSEEIQMNIDLQPLVIEETNLKEEAPIKSDSRDVQPLVLDGPTPTTTELAPTTTEPVAIEDLKFADLFDVDTLRRTLDLEIDLDIESIEGRGGISSMSSALVIKNAQASFGPLALSYGGGQFSFGAAVNLNETPELVRVYGSTSGWDVGKALEDGGAGVKVNGMLNGEFDLTGARASVRDFVNSMNGSVVVSMNNGRIATSLLELAGLGLFPWLFSKELQQGYTEIACFKAPLKIRAGSASSSAIVMETNSVQLVGEGVLDWVNDQIALHVEPRPIGRPLSRSAWPFEVSGRLSDPDITVDHGRRSIFGKRERGVATDRTPCVPDRQQSN